MIAVLAWGVRFWPLWGCVVAAHVLYALDGPAWSLPLALVTATAAAATAFAAGHELGEETKSKGKEADKCES